MKRYSDKNVLDAARERVAYAFDHFEKISVSFSGGKDSSVMLHLVMAEAIKRDRTVTVLVIDMEAQYTATINHVRDMARRYRDHIDLHWVCVPLTLRNAVTNYEPKWTCWDPAKEEIWVRPMPEEASTAERYPWFVPGMEFEEFVPLWSAWIADGASLASFVGIRADESLNRFRTIASATKEMHDGHRWTTLVMEQVYNIYPIYDWKTADIWRFHARYPDLEHNRVYDLMHQAGVPLSQQRLCQPYGDDQRRGLWLYHILEPATWFKLITRVNGANAGALYVKENGNVMGYNRITKPEGHTWKSFVNLLLMSLPKPTRDHYIEKFRGFIKGWRGRGYVEIPDEAPKVLEDAQWAPSWRRMAKVLLRNDYWCKGLGYTQPKSDAYGIYLDLKKARKGVAS
jgi:predicted phosphoadenosine phosphosulfate sulfurtransferase